MTQMEIEAFLEVVRRGTISGAAQALFITQPALSRRLQALEEELGYQLLERKKGRRGIELTGKGAAFIPVAHKWIEVWQEARELGQPSSGGGLGISAVGSVGDYILPGVFERLLEEYPDMDIRFHNCHSWEAYEDVERGKVDVALISDHMFSRQVETVPAFREPMLLICEQSAPYGETVRPRQLDLGGEIRLPWNPEYDLWHDYWFRPGAKARVTLDQMSLLEHFLKGKGAWAVVPASAAAKLRNNSELRVCRLLEGPPDRVIYYLLGRRRRKEGIRCFLDALEQEVRKIDLAQSLM